MKWFDAFSAGCARFAGRDAGGGFGFVPDRRLAFASGDDHFLGGASLAISTVTLLLLPILQATQNATGRPCMRKIELIRVQEGARSSLIGVEARSDEEIKKARRSEKHSPEPYRE